MAKIAHLRVTCPQCGTWTDIYVVESAASSSKVKCQHCKSVFVFRAGMMYDPVGYVSEIPNWARISGGKDRNTMGDSINPITKRSGRRSRARISSRFMRYIRGLI